MPAAGPRDVGAGDVRMLGIGFDGDELAARGQRSPHPDRAVAAQRADLEDGARTLEARQEMQARPARSRRPLPADARWSSGSCKCGRNAYVQATTRETAQGRQTMPRARAGGTRELKRRVASDAPRPSPGPS
jgi:hypothetical protein